MATYSSFLACRIPWTQEPGGISVDIPRHCINLKKNTSLISTKGPGSSLTSDLGLTSSVALLFLLNSSLAQSFRYLRSQSFGTCRIAFRILLQRRRTCCLLMNCTGEEKQQLQLHNRQFSGFFSFWSSILKRGKKTIFSPKKTARNLLGLFTHLSNTGTLKEYKPQRSLYSVSPGNEVPGLDMQTSASFSPPRPKSSPAPQRLPSSKAGSPAPQPEPIRVRRAQGLPPQSSLSPALQDGWRKRQRIELRSRKAALLARENSWYLLERQCRWGQAGSGHVVLTARFAKAPTRRSGSGGVTGRGELGFLGDGLQRVRPLQNLAVYWSELKPEAVSLCLSLFPYQRNGVRIPAYQIVVRMKQR